MSIIVFITFIFIIHIIFFMSFIVYKPGVRYYESQRIKAGAHLFFNAFWLIPNFCINQMYMRDPMHQIDSGVIISFLKAVLRKFRECVEFPLGIPGLGLQLRSLQTDCVDSSVKKKLLAAISCTVPTRVWFQ